MTSAACEPTTHPPTLPPSNTWPITFCEPPPARIHCVCVGKSPPGMMTSSQASSLGENFHPIPLHQDALAAAQEAIRLRDGVLGVEEQLISSLHLAAFEARAAGDAEAAEVYEARAKNLETEIGRAYFA